MPQTHLVTGAAGFLGSHLAVELALSGARIYALARGRDGSSASERIGRLRDYFRPRGIWPPPGLTVIEGDVEEPWLGLGQRPARRLFGELDEVIHCAARVDFSEARRRQVMATNVAALEGFLPLLAGGGPVFNLVSTAYVCGATERVARELPVPAERTFRNPYEESKALAERFVLRRLAARGIPWRILRPSIVVGEATTGRTRSFNAIYLLFQLLDQLQKSDRRREGRNEEKGNGPRLRIRCDPDSALSLVPVDWLTAAIRVLVSRQETQNEIFHLTQPRPMAHRELGKVLSRLFDPLRLDAATDEDFESEPPSPRETLLQRGLRIYDAYLDRHPRFDDRNTRRMLEAAGLGCPPVNEIWLGRLLGYARSAKWGRGPRLETENNGTSTGGPRRVTHGGPDDLRRFFDHHLQAFRGRPLLPGTRRVDAVFEVQLTDVPGFRRTVEIRNGELQRVRAGGTPATTGATEAPKADCRYELPSGVFRQIVSARLDPREAFFTRRTEIRGDMEAGLRVASLMVDFFRRHPYPEPPSHPPPSGVGSAAATRSPLRSDTGPHLAHTGPTGG